MTSQKCPICDGELLNFISEKSYQILKCKNCGLGKTKNLKAILGEYHRDDTYIQEEDLFRNIFLRRTKIIQKVTQAKDVLEVGCSTGLMLKLLENHGIEVFGVEISRKSAKLARSRGIDVLVDDFLQVKLNKKFDVVVFNHTLEHVDNPEIYLKKAVSLLDKDGYLYIDLPNFDSLTAKLLKSNWPLLLPNEHLWHFTPKSLDILLGRLGLKIIFVNKMSGIWDYDKPVYGLSLSLFGIKKRFFAEFLTAIPSLVTSKLGLGSDLMIIANKI